MISIDRNAVDRAGKQLDALTEISKTLTQPLELPELLDRVIDTISGVLEPAEAGLLMLWDNSAGLFRAGASYGFDKDIIKRIGLRDGESVTGKVFNESRAYLLNTPGEIAEAMADMRPPNREIFARAAGTDAIPICILGTPVSVGDQRYGVLLLDTFKGPGTFQDHDLPFIQTIADLVALAIERARLEARADAVREARETERLRSELMAMLSHELRLPLTAIKGYASALVMKELSWSEEKQKDFLLMIDQECDNMQIMLRDILDSSLIEVNQLNLELEPLRLHNLAREVAFETSRRTDIHSIIVDFPPDFPLVDGDTRWIKQVFRNIFDNAIKYSPDGGLVVVRGEVRTNDVVISIADQGVGISPEDQIPIFEKYFRGHMAPGFRVAGTGLGLPIARAIIEAHGGKIWVESKLGEGTIVYFSLQQLHKVGDSED